MMGDLWILECPLCSQKMVEQPLPRSLGEQERIQPQQMELGACPSCEGLFWLEDARSLPPSVGGRSHAFRQALSFQALTRALEQGHGDTPERELKLRRYIHKLAQANLHTPIAPELALNSAGFFLAGYVLYCMLQGAYSLFLGTLAVVGLVGAACLLTEHLYGLIQEIYLRQEIQLQRSQSDSVYSQNLKALQQSPAEATALQKITGEIAIATSALPGDLS